MYLILKISHVLAMGTIMAMSGAYIAMVMAESSAANALAIGALNG